MRILFVGDIVGKPGMKAAVSLIPQLRREHRADAVVVNCENAVAGRGVSPEIADELLRLGVDVLTGGNHVWRLREIDEYLELESRLLRPANYPKAQPLMIPSRSFLLATSLSIFTYPVV